MEIHFQNLTLIPKLIELVEQQNKKIENLEQLITPKLDLTKLSNVAKYLNVTKKTIYNYIDDGRFKQNIHYKKILYSNSVKIVFIESAIKDYKKG